VATLNLAMGQRYFDAGMRRDVSTLLAMQAELFQLGRTFQEAVSGGHTRIDGAYDKVLWWMHDRRFPLRLLPPYQGANPVWAATFADYVRDHYPGWIA
jgi:hypothetical protein